MITVISTAIPNNRAIITGEGDDTTVRYPAKDTLTGAAIIAIVGLAASGISWVNMKRLIIIGNMMAWDTIPKMSVKYAIGSSIGLPEKERPAAIIPTGGTNQPGTS